MTYSLISPSALGFDLVRQPRGPQIAQVILHGLAADESTLLDLAAADPAADSHVVRRRQWALLGRQLRETARGAVPQLRDMAVLLHGGDPKTTNDLLARGAIGNSADLERFIRSDVLGPGHRAAQKVGAEVTSHAANVLCDAALAHWAGGALSKEPRDDLSAPWDGCQPGPHLDIGAAHSPVGRLLAQLRTADPASLHIWRGIAATTSGQQWSAAAHEASWAAYLCDRSRELTTAHLLAVGAFRDAGLTGIDATDGLWSSLSGVLHALVVDDVVAHIVLSVLREPMAVAGFVAAAADPLGIT